MPKQPIDPEVRHFNYIAKSGDTHIIEVHGTNHSVQYKNWLSSRPDEHFFYFREVRVCQHTFDFTSSQMVPLSDAVLAIQLARFLKTSGVPL